MNKAIETQKIESMKINQQLEERSIKKEKKFKQYLQQKVNKIQQTKVKTIKTTEKYFNDMKQKMDKYLIKQQKKVLASYEDSINMSMNCLNHNYLYDFFNRVDAALADSKSKQNARKCSKQQFQMIEQQNIRKGSWQDHNQLAVKLQIKKLIEEMILAQNQISQNLKLIGQGIKNQIQKLISPLSQMLSKIPKLTKTHEQSLTMLIKQSPIKDNKKAKTSIKERKNQSFNLKNPQITYLKKYSEDAIKLLHYPNTEEMTEKLLTKQRIKNQSINALSLDQNIKKILSIRSINLKQDQILVKSKKIAGFDQVLKNFEIVNEKSVLYIFQKQKARIQNNQEQNNAEAQNQPNEQEQGHQLNYDVFLNEKMLISQASQNQYNYENFCKIQFESKLNREYLLVLTSKPQNVNQRKFKTFQFSIYNYKADLIIKEKISNFRALQAEKAISILQLESIKEFFYIILNNRIKRISLKNILTSKSMLFGTDEKIINTELNSDKLVLFQGRKMQIKIVSSDLMLLQVLKWTQIYPEQVQLNKLYTISIKPKYLAEFKSHKTHILNLDQKIFQKDHDLTLILPKGSVSSFYYVQNCFRKVLKLQYINSENKNKSKNPQIQTVQDIFKIQCGIYLILSNNKQNLKMKTSVYLLEICKEECEVDNEEDITGKIFYVETMNQEIAQVKYLNNHIYFFLKSGKIMPYTFY